MFMIKFIASANRTLQGLTSSGRFEVLGKRTFERPRDLEASSLKYTGKRCRK